MSSDLRRPPEGSALGLPATARALRAQRVRAGLLTGGGVAGLLSVVWLPFTSASPGGAARWAVAAVAAAALVVAVTGAVRLAGLARVRRVLARYPWVSCACHVRDTWPGQPSGHVLVVIDPPGNGTSRVLAVNAPRRPRPGFREACEAGGRVWFAGDPERGGVLSPPGGEQPLWGRPVRLGPLGRAGARRGRGHRAAGANPAGA